MCQPIQNSQAEDVESVMVDDHWLMPDGRVLTIDEDAVVTRARRRSAAGCEQYLVERHPNVPSPVSPMTLSAERVALDGDAVHEATMTVVVVERIVPRTAVVPERH